MTNFSIKSDPELNFSVFEAIEGLLNWAQKVVIGEIHGFYRVLVGHFQCNLVEVAAANYVVLSCDYYSGDSTLMPMTELQINHWLCNSLSLSSIYGPHS